MSAISGLQISSWFTVNGLLPEVSSCVAETGELWWIYIVSLIYFCPLCLYLCLTICLTLFSLLCVSLDRDCPSPPHLIVYLMCHRKHLNCGLIYIHIQHMCVITLCFCRMVALNLNNLNSEILVQQENLQPEEGMILTTVKQLKAIHVIQTWQMMPHVLMLHVSGGSTLTLPCHQD